MEKKSPLQFQEHEITEYLAGEEVSFFPTAESTAVRAAEAAANFSVFD